MSDAPASPEVIEADLDAFRAFLRDHSLPVTAQRLAIAEVVLGTERHLSAEEVAEQLKARGANAGTATIYGTGLAEQRKEPGALWRARGSRCLAVLSGRWPGAWKRGSC